MSTANTYSRLVLKQLDPHVLGVELHRPKKLNAFDPQMWEELRVCFEAIAKDPAVRCVVLSGAGRAFSAGLDLQVGIEML